MNAVLDSVALSSLLRSIDVKRIRRSQKYETAIDSFLKKGVLLLFLDKGDGIKSEWARTCNRDLVEVLITYWHALGAIRKIPPKTIPRRTAGVLRTAGFDDTTDKLILRTVLGVDTDRAVISNDPDFWDPSDNAKRGDRNALVARLLRDSHGIEVYTLMAAVTTL